MRNWIGFTLAGLMAGTASAEGLPRDSGTGDYSTVSGGTNNAATGTYSTVSGGAHNRAAGASSVVAGGFANWAQADAAVAGGYKNAASGYRSTVGAGTGNIAGSEGDVVGGGYYNWAAGPYAGVGAGLANKALGPFSIIGGGRGNTASNDDDMIGGGRNNQTSDTVIGGWPRFERGGGSNVVDGGTSNSAHGIDLVIGGGNSNSATGRSLVIAGGTDNRIEGAFPGWLLSGSVIGGGSRNRVLSGLVAGGTGMGEANVIAGGQHNAIDRVSGSVISGGSGNRIQQSGEYNDNVPMAYGTVAGGYENRVEGYGATIPGGMWNSAKGNFALGAGYKASAAHRGAFVWSDNSSESTFASSQPNELAARATGGVRLATGVDGAIVTAGVRLEPGGSQWLAVSDRNAKTAFAAVNVKAVLKALVEMPVTTWSYKAQDKVRHIGPMAQDFQKAFQVGEDKDGKTIGHMDALGVAYAAIQGLHEELKERDEQAAEMKAENEALKARLDRLEKMLEGK